jgi:hypothetical protein
MPKNLGVIALQSMSEVLYAQVIFGMGFHPFKFPEFDK